MKINAGAILAATGVIMMVGCTQQPHDPAMKLRDEWVAGHMVNPARTTPADKETAAAKTDEPPRLLVLANNGAVQPNARSGRPLKIAGREYNRGLYCHAVSSITVCLKSPAKSFSAIAGVDSNDQTSPGKGSVVFEVKVGDRSVFKSDVMTEAVPGRVVNVDLGGASEFSLLIGDAGDGISCDQADWADAKVTLEDGREIFLGDLQIVDAVTAATGAKAMPRTSSLPFSFVYGGKPSDELLAAWPMKTRTQKLDSSRTQRTWTWTDPASGLEVRCVAVEYSDFPVVEWTVYFRNGGKKDTPILENIQGLDTTMQRSPDGEFVLHGINGDSCSPGSYAPYNIELRPNANQRFAPAGGRATNGAFPYYNLQTPSGGVIVAVGWPGQWASSFVRDGDRSLRITAGQELTRMYLKSGEEIRSPLTALMFWCGNDTIAAQNSWRRWMLERNMLRPGGKTLKPLYAFCSGGFFPGLKVSEASERQFIDTLAAEKIKLDYWWMDAGWYACGSWPETGTWEYDPERFPNGIRAISDYLHSKGTKLILWFEPERATGGSWLAKNHPEWLLGGVLLNLGDADARAWLTNHISEFIKSQGIDLYRQDFNLDPLGFWRNNDASDRQGITENLHIQGYLAYWDALLKRKPDLLIDSCASGGRRNDLETLRRAVPLLRSDYQAFDGNPAFAPGNQAQTYGLSSWIPFYGQGVYHTTQDFVYCVRSHMCPSFVIAVDVRKPGIDWDQYRMLVDQWRQTADCMLGDFYPLTPYSLAEENWIAWQFNRPENGDGMVQAFRRTKSEEAAVSLKLRELQPDATYEVINFDDNSPRKASGRELMEQGLRIEIAAKPGSALIKYRRTKN